MEVEDISKYQLIFDEGDLTHQHILSNLIHSLIVAALGPTDGALAISLSSHATKLIAIVIILPSLFVRDCGGSH